MKENKDFQERKSEACLGILEQEFYCGVSLSQYFVLFFLTSDVAFLSVQYNLLEKCYERILTQPPNRGNRLFTTRVKMTH